MSFNLEIEKKKDYLHAIVTGENTPENVAINRGMPVRLFDSVTDAEEWLPRSRAVAE